MSGIMGEYNPNESCKECGRISNASEMVRAGFGDSLTDYFCDYDCFRDYKRAMMKSKNK